MGLDITAYSKATPIDLSEQNLTEDEIENIWDIAYDKGWEKAFIIDPSFHRSFRGLREGWYDVNDAETHPFRAGSYSGYSAWRNHLTGFAFGIEPADVWSNPDLFEDVPFFELIHFADNEGTIGPEAAADLYEDFVTHRDAYVAYTENSTKDDPALAEYYTAKYDDWLKAFDLARNGGLVDFH